MKTVLVVSDSAAVRDVATRALKPLDFEVSFCPGPAAPTYVCAGGRGRRCPLAAAADAVVLDLNLMSGHMPDGLPPWRLLLYYQDLGKGVVVLGEPGETGSFEDNEAVIVLPRPPDPQTLAAAVQAAILQSTFVTAA